MDVETVNYADPENAPIKAHLPGAMYHAKGFTPWGATRYGQPSRDAYVSVQGHWINADAFLIRYYLEGSRRARDLHLLWGQSIKRYGVWPGVSREVNNTANEIFALYQSTWDPDLLSLMDFQVENMMGAPLSKWPHSYHHPWFNPIWFARLHDMTRDPRIVPALVQYRADGFPGCQTMHAMIWRETGDKSLLDLTMPAVYNNVRTIYRNPGDPLDGYGSRIADPYTFHQQVLYWMQALNEAGVPGVGPGDAPPLYPATATHPQYIPSEPSALMLAAWDRDDREINIKLESRFEMYRPYLRVLSPSGKIVQEYQDKTPGATRFKDDQIVRLKVPADGEKGIYRLDFRN